VKGIKETSQMALKWAWDFDVFHKQLGHQWAKRKKSQQKADMGLGFGHLPQARHWANNGLRKKSSKG